MKSRMVRNVLEILSCFQTRGEPAIFWRPQEKLFTFSVRALSAGFVRKAASRDRPPLADFSFVAVPLERILSYCR
jgi:hypothetical protein